MATASDVINCARQEVGTKEYPANSNRVKYNTWYYGKEVSGSSYPWCAVFVSYVFAQCGGATLIKKSASCMEMAQWFKDRKQWHSSPQVGDVVFYKFETNNRWTNHVGIVVEVGGGGTITAIEGNTSTTNQDNGGSVMTRCRTKNIVGYGRPKYDTASNDLLTLATDYTKFPVLKKGSRGQYTLLLQKMLNSKFGYHLKEDSQYGSLTQIAVIDFQKSNHKDSKGIRLIADGVVGQNTWWSLYNSES